MFRPAAILIALLLGTVPANAGEVAQIEGTASFAGSEQVPDHAVLEVDLLDLSIRGEEALLLTRMRFEIPDGVPVAFALPYDTGLVGARGSYSLAGRIIARGPKGEQVLWRSTAILPVLKSSHDPRPEIFLEKLEPVVSSGTPVGYRWRVLLIDGIEPPGFTKARMTFDEDGSVFGNASCNNFTGDYAIDGQEISFTRLKQQRRGCQPLVMDRERAFLSALNRTIDYARDGDTLRLLDVNGLETMRLERE